MTKLQKNQQETHANYLKTNASDLFFAIYQSPESVFGGTWITKGKRKQCRQHLLTDGHESKDGNGCYITENLPYLICDGSDAGTNQEVIKFYQERYNVANYYDAVREVANKLGICISDISSVDNQYQKEREEVRKTFHTKANTAINDEATKRYLNIGRGLTDEEIIKAGIIYINADPTSTGYEAYKQTEVLISSKVPEESRPGSRGTAYKIVLPVYSGGRLVGLCYTATKEALQAEAEKGRNLPKYRLAKFADADTVTYGLRPASSNERQPWKGKTAVAVEGYFDYITANNTIRDGCFAYLHASISEEQAKEIAKAGYTSVILIPDYEGSTPTRTIAQGLREQIKHVLSSVEALQQAGIKSVYAADLQTPDEYEKSDANSISRETLLQRVTEAQKYTVFLAKAVGKIYQHSQETDRQQEEDKEFITYLAATESNKHTRQEIAQTAIRLFGDEEISNEIEKQQKDFAEREQRKRNSEICRAAADAIADGKTRTAKALLNQVKVQADEQIEQYTRPQTYEQILETANRPQDGIKMPIYADVNTKAFQVTAPNGGLSVISMPSGHGKTRLLENIILAILSQHEDKKVIYIHFEENNAETLIHMVSILANTDVEHDGRQFDNIFYALTEGKPDGGRLSFMSEADFTKIQVAASQMHKYINQRRLVLIDSEPTVEQIEAMISGESADDIAAICIDYIQKLETSTAKFNSKKELMEYSCDKINTIAKQTGVPIVVTSQLSRQAANPWQMSYNHNADATNIEQTAYLNLLAWNSKYKGSISRDVRTIGAQTEEELKNRGFVLGERGKIAIRVAKNRTGRAGDVWSVLDFDETTGKITPMRLEQ